MKIQNLERFKRKLAAMPQAARQEIHDALQSSAEEITDLMKRSAPVKSGALKRSIGYTFGDYTPDNANVRGMAGAGRGGHDLSVTIHAGDKDAYYAAFVEFGTQKHKIEAKNAPALHLNGDVFVEEVNHPGGTARPFFFPSWRIGKKKAKSRITRATNKAAKKVAAGG